MHLKTKMGQSGEQSSPVRQSNCIRWSMRDIEMRVTPGELLDKLTVVEVEVDRATNEDQRQSLNLRLAYLENLAAPGLERSPELQSLRSDLRDLNEDIRILEQDLNNAEINRDFGAGFTALARASIELRNRHKTLIARIDQHSLGKT